MARKRLAAIDAGPSRAVARAIAEMQGHLRRGDVRAIAVVTVMPGGQVGTVFAGHHDGHFHTLNSGISTLRSRFDREAS